ncbi:peptidylprolyl isomerase [Lutimonas sp.]|uniref:peptidylprolyl isomerase n=1 Tax=Lutimonas sp. TaxID=1872403 RepID=UPI003D9BEF04
MRIKKVMILSAMLISGFVSGQVEDKKLFSINGEDVYNSEFIRVYEKNKDIVVEDERKGFDDYFNLFVDFKLKLAQAREMKLDTVRSYTSELESYRDQLIQPYLQNQEATEDLIKEAYQRTVEEINASHILVLLEPDAIPADTLKAFNKIIEARNKVLNGAAFEMVAQEYSEDPSAQSNGGNLGYFSAFSMVYPFENAAYQTSVGDVSQPFRTQFGYHIIEVVDRRESPGEIQVAHIMVKNDTVDANNSRNKINEIYQKLHQGGDFATIAKEHSDDLSSAQKGGVLPKFGPGRMIKTFEDIAFDLQNEGDYSAPFKSDYGWHILKLLQKYPIPSYEELHAKLASKVKNGSRSNYVEASLAQKVGAEYQVVTYKAKLQLHPGINGFSMSMDTLLKVEGNMYTGNDFYEYAKNLSKITLSESYDHFKNNMVIQYYKDHLEETNKDFSLTYNEYKDGLLLFELLQKEVWEKSENDSLGLQQYFEANRDRYKWKKRAELSIASCTQKEKAVLVQELLLKDLETDSIKNVINEGARIHVLFSKGTLEEGSSKLPADYEISMGVSDIYEDAAHNFTIMKVDAIFEPKSKELTETRGEVMNDYQNYLEEEWVKELRGYYTVKVNQKNYKELKQRFELE